MRAGSILYPRDPPPRRIHIARALGKAVDGLKLGERILDAVNPLNGKCPLDKIAIRKLLKKAVDQLGWGLIYIEADWRGSVEDQCFTSA